MRIEHAQRDEARAIANELAKIARSATCCPARSTNAAPAAGNAGCACHHDPPRLHGPYWHWTRKIANKTVGKYLSKHQARECERWIDNDRRIRELVARLEAIGIDRLDAEQLGR